MRRTIIIGSGQHGRVVQNILNLSKEFHPVLFIDDNIEIYKKEINGLFVGGTINDLSSIKKEMKIDSAIIAIGSPILRIKISEILKNENIPVDLITTSETAISFSVLPKDTKKALSALEIFDNCKITSYEDMSIIGAVGEGIKRTVGFGGKLFTAVATAGVNIELSAQGASEINVSFVVKKSDKEKTIKVIHEQLIENGK